MGLPQRQKEEAHFGVINKLPEVCPKIHAKNELGDSSPPLGREKRGERKIHLFNNFYF
jgi:hypothetical protein